MINTREKYMILNKIHINGIENYAKQFNVAHDGILRKKYDHLDPR